MKGEIESLEKFSSTRAKLCNIKIMFCSFNPFQDPGGGRKISSSSTEEVSHIQYNFIDRNVIEKQFHLQQNGWFDTKKVSIL